MSKDPLTYEKVWQMFQETNRQFKETDKQFKETDKKIRSLENLFTGQWGKLIESLVEGDLVRLLNERGIQVTQTSERLKGRKNDRDYEIDIVAENGTEIVLVEVKTTLKPEDVQDFLNLLLDIKKIIPRYRDNTIYGAVAYLKTEAAAESFAEKQGLFVIRATGNSSVILNKTAFQPTGF